MTDIKLWNRRHKLKKQKLILEINRILDDDYKLSLSIFIRKVEDRKKSGMYMLMVGKKV